MRTIICSALMGLALAGCAANRTPIVAVAADTVGVEIAGGQTQQGGHLTLGYKGVKFAVVPTNNEEGELLALENGPGKQKHFSVFAMLGVDAKGGLATGAAVEQVLAVGPAAEIWAAGRARLTQEQARAAGLSPDWLGRKQAGA